MASWGEMVAFAPWIRCFSVWSPPAGRNCLTPCRVWLKSFFITWCLLDSIMRNAIAALLRDCFKPFALSAVWSFIKILPAFCTFSSPDASLRCLIFGISCSNYESSEVSLVLSSSLFSFSEVLLLDSSGIFEDLAYGEAIFDCFTLCVVLSGSIFLVNGFWGTPDPILD